MYLPPKKEKKKKRNHVRYKQTNKQTFDRQLFGFSPHGFHHTLSAVVELGV